MKKNYCTWMAVWSILLGSVWVCGAEFASENVKIIQEKKSAYGAKANTILAKHLQLVAGKKLAPGKDAYKFVLREKDLGNEGKWETNDKETVFTGKGLLLQYAVLDFLEKQLGIIWMDYLNTVYKKQDKITLKNISGGFVM